MVSSKSSKHVIIQQRIDEAMKREFEKLLRENKKDTLLALLIDGKLDDIEIEDLKSLLSKE